MISDNAVADLETRDIFANSHDLAARLVSGDYALIGFGAVALFDGPINRAQVGAAQAGRFDLQQNFVGAGRWNGKFADFQLAIAGQNNAGHGLRKRHEQSLLYLRLIVGQTQCMISIPLAARREPGPTIYEKAGGQEPFFRLTANFYNGVADDPILRPFYPDDLKESAWWLALFLMQFCGGPGDYSGQRGHPRLRLRHAPFAIGVAERDAWMKHMTKAVEDEIENAEVKAYLMEYFERTATFLINRKEA